eukprot:m.164851 g.164851  ORF g.164851 m.164851 type:complete len:777 (+) comp38886_c2_seq46:48-2378(+)
MAAASYLSTVPFVSVLFLLLSPLLVEGDGTLQIQLLKYQHSSSKDSNGYCCDSYLSFWCNDCDNYFQICYRQFSPPSDATCLGKKTTGDHFDDSVTFKTGSGALGNRVDNPMSFDFKNGWAGSFSLKVTIMDDDGGALFSGNDDFVDALRASIRQAGISSVWTSLALKGTYSKFLNVKWRVQCKASYYGDCSVQCVPQDSDQKGHYTCDSLGRRACRSGWQGAHCRTPVCKTSCSQVNGYCLKPGGCRCVSGWSGNKCDLCLPKTGCVSGTCINAFECNCNAGWMGSLCNQDATGCKVGPCLNGGTCKVIPDSFQCTCPADYVGTNCEIDQNMCRSRPCVNSGTCHNKPNDYFCVCLPGFIGKDCQTEIDECASSPCMYGFCNDTISSFTCTCHSGFTGRHCDSDIDECALGIDGCDNNANCVNLLNGGFRCDCKDRYISVGSACQLIQCPHLFLSNTTVVMYTSNERAVDSAVQISCLPGYYLTGKNLLVCQSDGSWNGNWSSCQDVNECSDSKTCGLNELCHNIEGSYECRKLTVEPSTEKGTVKATDGPNPEPTDELKDTLTTEPLLSPVVCVNNEDGKCFEKPKDPNAGRIGSDGKSSSSPGLYIGIAVGSVLLLILIVVIVVICRRRQKPAQLEVISHTRINNETTSGNEALAVKLSNLEEPVYDSIGDMPPRDVALESANHYEDMSASQRQNLDNPTYVASTERQNLDNPAYTTSTQGLWARQLHNIPSHTDYEHPSNAKALDCSDHHVEPNPKRRAASPDGGDTLYEKI